MSVIEGSVILDQRKISGEEVLYTKEKVKLVDYGKESKSKVFYQGIKRFADISLSLIALIVLLPLLLITALAVKIEDGGPVFFSQMRSGKNGKPFRMYKFRSMCVDAEEKLKDLQQQNEKDGPIFKMSNDPRVTKVGRFIRKTSIDELPQLINIIKGEMSVVGPRPALVREVEQYKLEHLQRLDVTPGLTCYWQISGRSDISFEEWIQLDIKYIEERSVQTDLRIIIMTFPVVLLGRGAY